MVRHVAAHGAEFLPTSIITDLEGRVLLTTAGIPADSKVRKLIRQQGIRRHE